jgi:hypothetical protein
MVACVAWFSCSFVFKLAGWDHLLAFEAPLVRLFASGNAGFSNVGWGWIEEKLVGGAKS